MADTGSPTFTFTLVNGAHGDLDLHLAGCADIGKALRRSGARATHHQGPTVVAALIAADTEMAWWFGEKPYTQSARDNGCWTVQTVEVKPCAGQVIRSAGVQFDSVTGRPYDPAIAPADRDDDEAQAIARVEALVGPEGVARVEAAVAAPAAVAVDVPSPAAIAVWAMLDPDQGVCHEGHPCELVAVDGPDGGLRSCGVDHADTGVPAFSRPIFAQGLSERDLALAAEVRVPARLIAWAREAIADREDSQTSTEAADRLMAEAETLAGTIADTLANGVLPKGLYGNEARLTRVVNHLRDAIEIMGEEVDIEPTAVDRDLGRDLGWIVSANEVAPHDVDRARRIIGGRLATVTEDLRLAGIGVWAEVIR